jgi:DNA-binding CsgD family transcriptional regulator
MNCPSLSEAEQDVLQWLLSGMSRTELSERLGLDEDDILFLAEQLYDKLRACLEWQGFWHAHRRIETR